MSDEKFKCRECGKWIDEDDEMDDGLCSYCYANDQMGVDD